MTEPNQNAFEAALQSDLAAARQQVAAVTDQLRAAEARNEAQAHRIDWLTAEVARVTASREQYERVGIRASAMLEGGTSMMIKLLQDLQGEIKAAAFTEVPGKVADTPEAAPKPEKPEENEDEDDTDADGDAVLAEMRRHAEKRRRRGLDLDEFLEQAGQNSAIHSELVATMRGDSELANSASLLPAPRFQQ